jgi:hypothetical protein
MFGVKGAMGDLQLEPKLLAEQFDQKGQAEVSLIFAGRKLTICYENNGMKDYGNYQIANILVNGTIYEANASTCIIRRQDIEALAEDEKHRILVELR